MFNGNLIDPKTMFIELECYQPYYTIKKDGYPSYEAVKKYTFRTKIRLDMKRVSIVQTHSSRLLKDIRLLIRRKKNGKR